MACSKRLQFPFCVALIAPNSLLVISKGTLAQMDLQSLSTSNLVYDLINIPKFSTLKHHNMFITSDKRHINQIFISYFTNHYVNNIAFRNLTPRALCPFCTVHGREISIASLSTILK